MTQLAELETFHPQTSRSTEPSKLMQYGRAFAGLFLRDLHVLRRELLPFVIRVCMNPLLFLFVFTFIMPHISGGAAMNPTAAMAGNAFSTVLLPGLMAVAIMFSGIAAVALPLGRGVAMEKICFSALQRLMAAAIVFPLAYYVPATHPTTHVASWPFLLLVVLLASLTAGALGLTIGTSVKPQQIGFIFGVVVIPITFLGCVYYPWAALTNIKWLQVGVLLNPIVYMSEGLRAALTPSLPHMHPALILSMLVLALCLLTWIRVRGFLRRVIG